MRATTSLAKVSYSKQIRIHDHPSRQSLYLLSSVVPLQSLVSRDRGHAGWAGRMGKQACLGQGYP